MSWDVIGHDWAVTLLRKHISDGRTRHAYLFVGPEAVGKRTLATQFAKALNCNRAPEPGEFCGECRACRHILTGTYPDLELLSPDPSIIVDDVRELQRGLPLAPYEGSWKIALLDDFHRATTTAANAMLKTLEEPPDRVVLMLTATSQEQLLPTVVSRCEVVALRGVSSDVIAQALVGQGVETDRAKMLAVLSEGRPGRALRWHANPERFEQRSSALDQLLELLGLDIRGRFAMADRILGKGDLPVRRLRARSTLEVWLSLWRDLLYQGYEAEVQTRNPDRLPAFVQATQAVRPEERYQIVRSLSATLAAIEGYADPVLAVETFLLKLPMIR